MYWFYVFISLQQSYSIILINFILIFSSVETITERIKSNHIQDLLSNIHDKTIKRHSFNIESILHIDNRKKSSSTDLTLNNRIFTLTTMKTVNCTFSPIVNHSPGYIDRKLLNEPNINTSSLENSSENNDEIEDFLKVDNEELSKELINTRFTIDGSGDTTEPTSETTTVTNEPITSEKTTIESTLTSTSMMIITLSTIAPIITSLSEYSIFYITVDCTNASFILNTILEQFHQKFNYLYNVTYNNNILICKKSSNIDVPITFTTNNNITILTNLFSTLENIVSSMGIKLQSFDKCGNNETAIVTTVTSCYLIDLCNLCGINPRRGICLPENNISKCECFINEYDTSIIYSGEFCLPIKSTDSPWILIIVGILSGLIGLFCIITCFILLMKYSHYRHGLKKENQTKQHKVQIHRSWHIPRIKIPTINTNENFQQFDQIIDSNRPTIITRSRISNHDPIDELDTIIDDYDSTTTIYDPLNDLTK